jgi:hypothetical protein
VERTSTRTDQRIHGGTKWARNGIAARISPFSH